jgi:hypothetical protein
MYLGRSSNSAKLMNLASNTLYFICVLGIGNWLTYQNDYNSTESAGSRLINGLTNAQNEIYLTSIKGSITEPMNSRCTQIRTLYSLSSVMEMDQSRNGGFFHSLLTRRLGLIVGCALGILVFIVLVSVLGWLKIKKRRIELAKRQQMPQEFVSYHSYSISQDEQTLHNNNSTNVHHQNHIVKDSSKEALVNNLANCQHHHMHNSHGHPNYISGSVIGTTTIPM